MLWFQAIFNVFGLFIFYARIGFIGHPNILLFNYLMFQANSDDKI